MIFHHFPPSLSDAFFFLSFFFPPQLYFIKFFAPWCGHCKRLAPTWDQLAEQKTADDVVVAKVDCTKEKDVCSKAGVKGYPTLKVFHAGEEKVKYSGARTLEALGDFIEEQRKLYMAETEA